MPRHSHNVSFTEEEERKLQELLTVRRPRSLSAFMGHLVSEAYSRSLHKLVDPGVTYDASVEPEQ